MKSEEIPADRLPAAVHEASPGLETCWALVERIAASSHFKRAARLHDLLLFIGRRQLKEHCAQLHEQEIGVEVFGRLESYDTNIDNIVRANVSELRKRIETYFEIEGRLEPILLEIPRGCYRFLFRNRVLDPIASQDSRPSVSSIASVDVPAPGKPLRVSLAVGAILAILALSAACASLWVRDRALRQNLVSIDNSLYPWRSEPTVAAFWSSFLNSPQDTDVVVPDAALSQMEYHTRTTVSIGSYVDRSYLGQLQGQKIDPEVRDVLASFNSLNFVTLSAIKMADTVLALDPLSKKMRLYFSREYIPSFIDRDNVILLGDPVSNPFIQLIENRLNFTVDRVGNHLGPVVNRAPIGQEQSTYVASDGVGYCLVAYLPNPGHSGKFLLIQGTSPAATQGAEFFLLSEKQMATFQGVLSHHNSTYFEVLLRTSQVNGTPLAATIVAYRVHSDQ